MKKLITVPGGVCDSHVNAFDPKFEYPAEVAVHDEPILADELEAVFAENGVSSYIISQVLRDPRARRLFLGLSRKGLYPRGLVPLIDLRSPLLHEDLQSFRPSPFVTAVRDMLDALKPGEIDSAETLEGLLIAGGCRRVVNLVARAAQLDELGELLQKADPDRRGFTVALDHLGWPDIDGDIDGWERSIRELARNPGVVVKCSFLAPQADPLCDRFDQNRYFGLLSHVLSTFGISRMLYASDYPNSAVQTSYGRFIHTAAAWMDRIDMGASDRASFFADNAKRIYGELQVP